MKWRVDLPSQIGASNMEQLLHRTVQQLETLSPWWSPSRINLINASAGSAFEYAANWHLNWEKPLCGRMFRISRVWLCPRTETVVSYHHLYLFYFKRHDKGHLVSCSDRSFWPPYTAPFPPCSFSCNMLQPQHVVWGCGVYGLSISCDRSAAWKHGDPWLNPLILRCVDGRLPACHQWLETREWTALTCVGNAAKGAARRHHAVTHCILRLKTRLVKTSVDSFNWYR